jgi:hypothetical protein
MRHWLVAVVLVATGLGTAACGRRPVPQGGVAPPGPPADVVLSEWKIEVPPLRAGPVVLRVRNEGVVDHNLTIEGRPGADTGLVHPGATTVLAVRLDAATYTAFCNVPGHREAGMVAELRVTP